MHMYCVIDQNWSGRPVDHCCRSSDVKYAASFIAFDGFVCTLCHIRCLLKAHLFQACVDIYS